MLVLSRKEDQKVRFPALGITVQILRVKGSTVRVGVEAPTEVRIVRDELDDETSDNAPSRSYVIRLPQQLRHELRNELNSISIALHLFKRELEEGHYQDAEATFDKLVEHLERISSNQALSRAGALVEAHKPKALLVEDQPNEREMLAGFLRMHGFEVATAADGLEAMEYLESHVKPSVILIDMRMPRCDGRTAIRRIRENPAFDGVKIFAVSGSTPEESGLEVQSEEINRWFTKPVNPQSLVDAMAFSGSEPERAAS